MGVASMEVELMETTRLNIYIIVLLLALAATIGISYSHLLTGLTERTVARLDVQR